MNRRVLISGSSGFLGSSIREDLANLGIPLTLLFREGSAKLPRLFSNENILRLNWPEDLAALKLDEYRAVIYLSHAAVTESMELSEVLRVNLLPLNLLIERIKTLGTQTHLIFISSQSASSSVRSNYGELKRQSEAAIISSGLSFTIIRPGLIYGSISSTNNSGLFNSIKNFIRTSPVVPLIGSSENLIQPLFIKDFTKALIRLSGIDSTEVVSKSGVFEIATQPISFHEFLRSLAKAMKLKRLFVPVPLFLVNLGFWILEHVFHYRKITSSSLLGFLQLSELDYEKVWSEIKESPTTLEKGLA